MKTSELIGSALDWAVAKCEGKDKDCEIHACNILYGRITSGFIHYRPSTDWAQGGPIIERAQLCVGYQHQCDPAYVQLIDPEVLCWARTTAGGYLKYGPTPLIAAMRCFVASRLGDDVDIQAQMRQQAAQQLKGVAA